MNNKMVNNDTLSNWYICRLDSSIRSTSNLSSIVILNKTLLNKKQLTNAILDSINFSINKTIYINSDHIYHYYWLLFLVIEILVLIGNMCLIILILTNKSLYTNNTTRIVLSLALTDLLLSIFVMPFTLYSQISYANWSLGYGLCIVWLSSDVQLTTTSIFHLCCISYERYLSIAKPIVFRTNMKKRISYLIITNWLLSFFLVTLPFIILSIFDLDVFHLNNQYLPKTYSCTLASSSFIAYTTLITFWLPLVFMIFFGLKTMFLIRNLDRSHVSFHLNEVTETILKKRRDGFMMGKNSDKPAVNQYNYTRELNNDKNSATKSLNSKNDKSEGASLQNVPYQNSEKENEIEKEKNDTKLRIKFDVDEENTNETNPVKYERCKSECKSNDKYKSSMNIKAKRTISVALNRSNKFSQTLRKSVFRNFITTRKELQAQKTLSIVLIFFVLSYFPLFTYITSMSFSQVLNLNSGLIIKTFNNLSNYTLTKYNLKFNNYNCLIPNGDMSYNLFNVFEQQDVGESKNDIIFYSFTWLAYSSAIINPVLHLLLNNNFKNAIISCFKKNNF